MKRGGGGVVEVDGVGHEAILAVEEDGVERLVGY